MAGTFVDEVEAIVDEVSAWGVEVVDSVLEVLRPDGRGYGQEKISIDQQLEDYRQMRNSLEAWMAWIKLKSIELQNILINSGVTSETIGAVDTLKIATAYALDYSIKMETELNKRML